MMLTDFAFSVINTWKIQIQGVPIDNKVTLVSKNNDAEFFSTSPTVNSNRLLFNDPGLMCLYVSMITRPD